MNLNRLESGIYEKYGVANFDITHGSLSSKKTINVTNDNETIAYIHPQDVISKKRGEEFDVHFMVGAIGELFTYADEVRVSFHYITADSEKRELIIVMPVPKEVIQMNHSGFDVNATLTGISFDTNVKMFMNVEAVFTDQSLIDILNRDVEDDKDLIRKNVVVSINAAKLFVNVKDDRDGK